MEMTKATSDAIDIVQKTIEKAVAASPPERSRGSVMVTLRLDALMDAINAQ